MHPQIEQADSQSQNVSATNVALDELGPMVIQTDGTFVRIIDWKDKSDAEKAQISRVIAKRNKERLENLKMN